VLVLGYGGSGSTAAGELAAQGIDAGSIVVVDENEASVRLAADRGFTGLSGDATSEDLLRVAGAERARAAVVVLDRDDTTVLTILTLRHLSKGLRIVATVREQENRKLLYTAGADVVVAPFQVGGFLLADAVNTREAVEVLTDLLSCEGSMQVVEVRATEADLGLAARQVPDKLVVAIRRGPRLIRFWEDPMLTVQTGDVLIAVAPSNGVAKASRA
jgi:voltage-gated potassium channel